MTKPRSNPIKDCSVCSPAKARKPAHEERAELRELVDKITDLVGKDPRKAAIVLSDWVNRADSRPTSKSPSKKKSDAA